MYNCYPVIDEVIIISMEIFERLREMARITRHDQMEARAQFYGEGNTLSSATDINGAETNRHASVDEILSYYRNFYGDNDNKTILDVHTHLRYNELNSEEVYADDDFRRFTSSDITTHVQRSKALRDNGARYLSAVIGCDANRGSATLSIVGLDNNNAVYHPSTINVTDNNGVVIGALKLDHNGLAILEDFGQKTRLTTVA